MYIFRSIDNRTEKNASPWSKERLKELLKGLEMESDQGRYINDDLIKLYF